MIKVAFIVRSTLYKVPGGSTVQAVETARHLRKLGTKVSIYLAHEKVNYKNYDLLHFFDVVRPANILFHIKNSRKPFFVTPVLLDYSEYDKRFRKGFSGMVFRHFSANSNEYIKTVSRWLLGKDSLQSKNYLWKGQKKSVQSVLHKAAMVLPNSKTEYDQLLKLYHVDKPYAIIPYGIDTTLFQPDNTTPKNNKLILCAALIEGRKNQLKLIKALNNTDFRLVLLGEAAPNHKDYFHLCKKIASNNIEFTGRLSQKNLAGYYKQAKVHILPSWFETCGLSSMEAAAMGCNIVITNKGYTHDYFGDDAFYCNPESEESIYQAVKKAAESPLQKALQEKILKEYTWEQAASQTLEAYKKIV